ncbi:hypothetical protein EPN44_16030 [bacterium]|nr:MAG: hypothetical protein EPN44_16030 [bacterium]
MKRISIIPCIVFCAAAAASGNNSYDFKGVQIGAPATPEMIRDRLGIECGAGAPGMLVCNGNVTIAKERASMNLVIGRTGEVQRIHLSLKPDQFDLVEPELIRKFGPPARVERPAVQNAMGATFQQTRDVWIGTNGVRVVFERYAGSIDSSSLYFSTEADRRLMSGADVDRSGDL